MSSVSRRTTRATSRAASSTRGASPAIEEQDIPVSPSSKRSTRRAISNAPLPQVGLRTNNSYGTNQLAQSSSIIAPEIGQQIQSSLGNILEPVREDDDASTIRGGRTRATAAGRRRRMPTLASSETTTPARQDRSFNLESGIFDGANIDSSSVVDPSENSGIPEYPQANARASTDDHVELQTQRELVEEIARNTRVKRAGRGTAVVQSSKSWIYHTLAKLIFYIFWGFLFVLALFVFCKVIIAISTPIRKILSSSASSTGEFFNTDEVTDLQKRMKAVETEIVALSRKTDLDHQTLERLQNLLPNTIVCMKDKNGDLIIPDDFWSALLDRIRKEDSLFEKEINLDSKSTSKTGLSTKDVRTIAEKAIADSEKTWNRFLDKNKERIINWDNDDFANHVYKYAKKYSETHLKANKEEFVEAIKKNWVDTQYELQSQIGPLSKQLQESVQRFQKLEKNAISKEQARKIAHDIASKLIPHTKLSAQSNANIKYITDVALTRVNHFSPGTGAVINPILTSPNYLFPSMQGNVFSRVGKWLFNQPIPRPKPASVALQKWEEHGDCWCSPSTDPETGFGPSLAVITSNYVQPDHIIVEHIQEAASLEPGAAPKDMELLAYIEDEKIYSAIKNSRLGDAIYGEPRLAGWVRLGTWIYDAASDQSAQSFPLIDLKEFGETVSSNQFIVRAKDNWNSEDVKYTCMYRVRLTGDVVFKK